MLPSDMNPYASFLGDRNALEVVAATSEKLARLAKTLGPERIDQPTAPGKWSVREILCHLADTEQVFAFRLRQSLAEDHHVIQPFDQDRWAAMYGAYQASEALQLFSTARAWNLALLRAVPAEAFTKPLTHPERGGMTFQVLVETMAGHDLNHLSQIESFAAKSVSV